MKEQSKPSTKNGPPTKGKTFNAKRKLRAAVLAVQFTAASSAGTILKKKQQQDIMMKLRAAVYAIVFVNALHSRQTTEGTVMKDDNSTIVACNNSGSVAKRKLRAAIDAIIMASPHVKQHHQPCERHHHHNDFARRKLRASIDAVMAVNRLSTAVAAASTPSIAC